MYVIEKRQGGVGGRKRVKAEARGTTLEDRCQPHFLPLHVTFLDTIYHSKMRAENTMDAPCSYTQVRSILEHVHIYKARAPSFPIHTVYGFCYYGACCVAAFTTAPVHKFYLSLLCFLQQQSTVCPNSNTWEQVTDLTLPRS